MAAVALRLGTIHTDIPAREMLAALNEEAGVLDVAILDPPKDLAQDTLADLELGRELFRPGTAEVQGQAAFRAFVPFHFPRGLRMAILCDGIIEPDDQPIMGSGPARPVLFKAMECQAIMDSLQSNNGNRTRTAQQLGISLRTLQYRLRDYGNSNSRRENCIPIFSTTQVLRVNCYICVLRLALVNA